MLYLVITVVILAIIVIYYIPNKRVDKPKNIALGISNWQPTVCDPFYQYCCKNSGWTYSDGYFYPLFIKNI